jgi:triacylglycerol lipase
MTWIKTPYQKVLKRSRLLLSPKIPKFDFNPAATKYDLKNALRLAQTCELAYKSERTIKVLTKHKWGFEKFKFFDVYHTQAFMIAKDDVIVLSFRGTESIQDWITDSKIKFVEGPFGKVHRGFLEALDYVWNDIVANLIKFQTNAQPFWITGHSLGGALANLAVAKFTERKNIKINGLYTFGQPRIGNKTFAKNFDAKFRQVSFRFINNEDIVTRIPPSAFGYEHIGQVAYIDNVGKIHRGARWWQMFMDMSVSTIIRALDRYKTLREQFPNGLEDHAIARYIALISANLKNEK